MTLVHSTEKNGQWFPNKEVDAVIHIYFRRFAFIMCFLLRINLHRFRSFAYNFWLIKPGREMFFPSKIQRWIAVDIQFTPYMLCTTLTATIVELNTFSCSFRLFIYMHIKNKYVFSFDGSTRSGAHGTATHWKLSLRCNSVGFTNIP